MPDADDTTDYKAQYTLVNYVCAFGDLLGMRCNLLKLDKAFESGDREIITQVLRDSVFEIDALRKTFSKFEADASKLLAESPKTARAEEMLIPNVDVGWFSDSITANVEVGQKPLPAVMASIFCLFMSLSSTFLFAISQKVFLRMGIAYGPCIRLAGGEICGAGSVRAYALETDVAVYPRIVVEDRVVEYLKSVNRNAEESFESNVAGHVAGTSLSLISRDSDGQWILDPLGQGFHHLVPNMKDSNYAKAAAFNAREQEQKWRTLGNEKIHHKFQWLVQYFRKRGL